ncbi:Uma2 family endonuclease [Spirosoma arcticum]
MQTLTRPISYREFREMEFAEHELEEFIVELIDGQIVPRNYPTATHQRILADLHLIIGSHVKTSQLGRVLFAPFGVVLDDFDDVQPDLMFVTAAKQNIIREDGIFGIPDLLVEIISPSSIRTDRGKKFKLYERMDVPEYWIVDINNRSIEVYQRQESGYELVSFAAEQGEVESLVLAGLRVEVRALFM